MKIRTAVVGILSLIFLSLTFESVNGKPAQTTASPSNQQEKATDSDAHSTDGAGQKAGSQPSRKARTRTTDSDEFDEFA